jgi:hypothetical protein
MTYLIWLWENWAICGFSIDHVEMGKLCGKVIGNNNLNYKKVVIRYRIIEGM